MKGLAVDVGRGSAREGGQEDIGAVRVISSLLEGVCHHGIDGGDEERLAASSSPVHHHERWSGTREILLLGEDGVGDHFPGIVEGQAKHFLLPPVQLSCLFHLSKAYCKNFFAYILIQRDYECISITCKSLLGRTMLLKTLMMSSWSSGLSSS